MSFQVPILLLMFNRPHLVKAQLARLKDIRPATLYVSSDGPRVERHDEARLVEACRSLIEQIDWPCEIHKKYESTNLGCGHGVSSAISWFFDNVEAGIILEDDCQLSETFFPYCSELLEKYRNVDEVAGISADFRLLTCERPRNEYGFTRFAQIWGWASWRRVWRQYDYEISDWKGDITQVPGLLGVGSSGLRYWKDNFDRISRGEIDTWDFQLSFLILSKGWKFIHPMCNLVTNIGYASDATHTRSKNDATANLPAYDLSFPLTPNLNFVAYDNYLASKSFVHRSLLKKVARRFCAFIKRWV